MTRVTGTQVRAAPCCGAVYAHPIYGSMNFSAHEYWTDGWRERSLMPNDTGLRRCRCGRFLLTQDLLRLEVPAEDGLTSIPSVPDEDLPACLAGALPEAVEVAARLQYWRHLNHAYRVRYREHRAAEESATRAAWEAAHPDRRTWWDRLLRRPPPRYSRPPGSPFTYPPFQPSPVQLDNMQRLSALLQAHCASAASPPSLDQAELYREQGRFDEAAAVMAAVDPRWDKATHKLITELIDQRQTAPMRYRA